MLQVQSAKTAELHSTLGNRPAMEGLCRQSPSGRHRQAWGSGGLIARLTVHRGLRQFDGAVDNNNTGGEEEGLIRLFQDEKRGPLPSPLGTENVGKGREIANHSGPPGFQASWKWNFDHVNHTQWCRDYSSLWEYHCPLPVPLTSY